MDQSQLRVSASVFDELECILKEAEPAEGGVFLLVGHAEVDGHVVLSAHSLIRPPASAWRLQGRARLAPSTAWMSEVLGEADDARLGLAFVHSHPGPSGFTEFSGADEWMHEQLVPAMVSNLDGRAFGSFVYASGRMEGAAWWGGRRHHVRRITVVGRRLREIGEAFPTSEVADAWDRQVRLWGPEGQARLGALKVGIVGAGGTGSAFAEQLARLGVGRIVIIDHDTLEDTNVSRVYGSKAGQAGMAKVDVATAHLDQIRHRVASGIAVSVETQRGVFELRGCDIIVGCTDSHASRAVLNDVAVQYLIPYIDVGCRIVPHRVHATFIPVEVRHVFPGGPCLWCMGDVLDGRRIREEGLPVAEREALLKEGYVSGLQAEPSVIPVTTLTATLGVLRVLGLMLGTVEYPGTRVIGDLRDLEFTFVEDQVSEDCVCRGRKARGDLRPIK